jgi:hypothetical protein
MGSPAHNCRLLNAIVAGMPDDYAERGGREAAKLLDPLS